MSSPLISAEELKAALETGPAPLVFDCRHRLDDPDAGQRLYREGHLPGALFAHLENDLRGPVRPGRRIHSGRHPLPGLEDWRQRLGRWGVTPEREVVVYDDMGGAYAARLWWMLRAVGHRAVAVLDGGLQAWQEAGGELEAGTVESAPASEPYPELVKRWPVAELDEVLDASVAANELLLVDARDETRYRGEAEPIDPVAGRIPGAVNAFHQHNLDPSGRFLPRKKLRERWKTLMGKHKAEQLVCYCGSGVTACHDLLALEVAGLEGARLFPPSWSGWCRTEGLPFERGK